MNFLKLLAALLALSFGLLSCGERHSSRNSGSYVYMGPLSFPIGGGGLRSPLGIFVDASGNIYTADQDKHTVQKFAPDGTYISQFGGLGTGNGKFSSSYGLAQDSSGNIYLTDYSNDFIQKFDSNGNFVSQFGGGGTGDGQFDRPSGIAIDGSDNIYVVDRWNNRVQVFDSNGNFIRKFGTVGAGDGQMNSPVGIALDNSGNIYVTEYANNRVQKFDSNGVHIDYVDNLIPIQELRLTGVTISIFQTQTTEEFRPLIPVELINFNLTVGSSALQPMSL